MDTRNPKLPILLDASCAADMMTPKPLSVYDTDSVEVAAGLLTRFSAVPVVDSSHHIVGVLSRTDLVRAQDEGTADDAPALEIQPPLPGEEASGLEYRPPVRVRVLMTPRFISVGPDAAPDTVIRKMVEHTIGRVFVVDDRDHLVGVISSWDVLTRLAL